MSCTVGDSVQHGLVLATTCPVQWETVYSMAWCLLRHVLHSGRQCTAWPGACYDMSCTVGDSVQHGLVLATTCPAQWETVYSMAWCLLRHVLHSGRQCTAWPGACCDVSCTVGDSVQHGLVLAVTCPAQWETVYSMAWCLLQRVLHSGRQCTA